MRAKCAACCGQWVKEQRVSSNQQWRMQSTLKLFRIFIRAEWILACSWNEFHLLQFPTVPGPDWSEPLDSELINAKKESLFSKSKSRYLNLEFNKDFDTMNQTLKMKTAIRNLDYLQMGSRLSVNSSMWVHEFVSIHQWLL